jgi:ABC-type polysaccharide/polyol phosphate export permease
MSFKLIWELAKANLKSRYRNTWAGFLWVILNPMIMFGVQSLIFKHVLKLNVDQYYIFLLSGLLPWIFLVQSSEMSTSLFIVNGPLLKSFKMDPRILVIAQLMDNFINFISVFIILFLAGIFLNDFHQFSSFLWLPFALAILILAASGISLILATLQVFFRDTRFIIQFLFQILFFLTPIFYPVDFIPEKYRFLVSFNPFFAIISSFRSLFIHYSAETYPTYFLTGALWTLGIWVIALSFWKLKRNELILRL